ncbi:MAG TPA: hypothetical protein VFE14_12055, partial [Micromonosporaceae bacterium]|nr:hypothetical protein [Micromonosporaceae bacterium]
MAWEDLLDEFLRQQDLSLLDGLTPYEREHVIDALLAAAARGNIPAIQGLAHLRADRAAEPLQAIMRRYGGTVRIYAAAAVWWLRRDPEALGTLCTELTGRRPRRRTEDRVHAAAVLSQIDHPDARRALAAVI